MVRLIPRMIREGELSVQITRPKGRSRAQAHAQVGHPRSSPRRGTARLCRRTDDLYLVDLLDASEAIASCLRSLASPRIGPAQMEVNHERQVVGGVAR